MMQPIRKLPAAELEVMQALWDCQSPATRTDIQERLSHSHPIAVTTLLTVLTRLSEKGFLHIEKQGRSHLYTPLISKESYLAQQSMRFFQKLCGGNLSTFATALCDSGLSKEELAQLRDLLERGTL